MMSRKEEIIAAAATALAEGKTLTEVARNWKVSLGYVSRLAKDAGLTPPREMQKPRRQHDWPRIFEEADGKLIATEIARRNGVTPGSVRAQAIAMGVELPSGSHRRIDWQTEFDRALRDGETRMMLSRRLGAEYGYVRRMANKLGVDFPQPEGKAGRAVAQAPDTVALRASLLRAARAAVGLQQLEACGRAGIAENTLLDAEAARRVSDRTWNALREVYGQAGVKIELAYGRLTVKVIKDGA